MKVQPSRGHIFHARSCVRRDYLPEVMEIASYCTKKGSHVSQAGVGEIPFHHQVMSNDIDDNQEPKYHMNRRTFF